MKVKTKLESIEKISALRLNHMPYILASENGKEVEAFFNKHSESEFVVRDLEKPNGEYFFCKNYAEFCEHKLSGLRQIAVSFANIDGKVILGDIKVSGNTVSFSASTKPNANHRNVYNEGEYNFVCDLGEEKPWKVPGFEKLIYYVINHNLYDVIVEFVVFDHCVGENEENIVICELRSEY